MTPTSVTPNPVPPTSVPLPLVEHLHGQGAFCAGHGSPMYGQLCAFLADDVAAGGVVAELLKRWAAPTFGLDQLRREVPGLRLLGGLHRLVLTRRAPELALFYPSVGGTGDVRDAWPVVRGALLTHADELREGLAQPPQTNEVGRAAPLLKGLGEIAVWTGGLPVRLVEIGTSAGLNLRVDQLPIGAGRLIDPGPDGLPRPDAPSYRVVSRVGGDLHPIDPTTPAGRTTLTSYVWPDDLVRFERLRVALDVARDVPVDLRRVGAADLVEGLRLEAGTVTVLWHSVMWQYVGEPERQRVREAIERLGAEASQTQRFAHVRFEPAAAGDRHHELSLDTWPGERGRLLGTAPPHGL